MVLFSFLPITANLAIFYGSVIAAGLLYLVKKGFLAVVLLTASFSWLHLTSYTTPSREDFAKGISFFTAIYDPFVNQISGNNHTLPAGLSRCHENRSKCSALDDQYHLHSSWMVDFFDKYTAENATQRRFFLWFHIWCLTIAGLISMSLFYKTFRKNYPALHRYFGYGVVGLSVAGLAPALLLGIQNENLESYGGSLGAKSWYSMVGLTLFCLARGVIAARNHDYTTHKHWMYRFFGACYGGTFAILRLWNILVTPFYPNSWWLAQWLAAPLGMIVAEYFVVQDKAFKAEKKKKADKQK